MANIFLGLSGVARKVGSMYVGVDGVARKVKAAYVGVDGGAKLFFGGEYVPAVNEVVEQCSYGGNIISEVVYPAGRYRVEIAGYPSQYPTVADSTNCFTYDASVTQPFIIRGYCGDTTSIQALGLAYDIASNGGIFGGGGGQDARASTVYEPYGNSLSEYGAVCHFMPVGGTFGTDYLWCFHCAPSPKGGAYGGGAGGFGGRYSTAGGATVTTPRDRRGGTGGTGAGGTGGTGGYGTVDGNRGYGPTQGNPGDPGSGIGAGTSSKGGVAVYNGLHWLEPTRSNVSRSSSYIRVTYLGTN